MSKLTKHMMEFEDMIDDAEIDQKISEMDAEELDDMGVDEMEADPETAYEVVKNLMGSFKAFCDACEAAWKIQEIPAPLRQRLISLDQHNQEKYQKLYLLVQKHKDYMKNAKLSQE